jgi:hypothetical protein
LPEKRELHPSLSCVLLLPHHRSPAESDPSIYSAVVGLKIMRFLSSKGKIIRNAVFVYTLILSFPKTLILLLM